MKRLVILVTLFFIAFNLNAQDITGIWRGYFISGTGFYRQKYKYEIQIEQLKNNSLNGVTYSYKTTVFYGKATLRGIYMASANNILIQEVKLVEVKIADQSEPCIMTCYLDYSKDGELEVMQGTFTSVNDRTKGDCGAGTVYLEKVPESDFQKEDFLVKREQEKMKEKQKKDAAAKVQKSKLKNNLSSNQKPIAKSSTPQKKSNLGSGRRSRFGGRRGGSGFGCRRRLRRLHGATNDEHQVKRKTQGDQQGCQQQKKPVHGQSLAADDQPPRGRYAAKYHQNAKEE